MPTRVGMGAGFAIGRAYKAGDGISPAGLRIEQPPGEVAQVGDRVIYWWYDRDA